MSRFNVDNINYIVAGKTETIINLDATEFDNNGSPTETISNNWSFVTDSNVDKIGNFKADYNSHRLLKYRTDEAGTISSEPDSSDIIHAIFDFKDIAVKSDSLNNNVYGPNLKNNPIGFCQGIGSNAYGMSESTRNTTLIKHTNLEDTRFARLSGNSNSMRWKYKLDENDSSYTYPTLSSLSSDSYYQYVMSQGPNVSALLFEDVFSPQTNHLDIEKNYLYEFFMSNKKSNMDKYNDFNIGEMLGNSFGGKNMYDSTYSMNMPDESTLSNIRNYVGLGTTGGRLYLKYYDETNFVDDNVKTLNESGIEETNTTKESSNTSKYQNVEYIDSINRFVSKSNHKSNLYSIRLNNLELDSHPELSANLESIKRDIQQSVRMIAEGLAPAHTQLFKVYIDS